MCGLSILIGLGVVYAIFNMPLPDKPTTATATAPAAPVVIGCEQDWKKCADNTVLMEKWSGLTDVRVKCKLVADDKARYVSPDWPWIYFEHYFPGRDDIDDGKVFILEPDAQFPNMYGAKEKGRVT